MLTVEVVPLPKVHNQDVGAPVEVSARVTTSGAVPEVAEAVKIAVGAVGAAGVVRALVVEVP